MNCYIFVQSLKYLKSNYNLIMNLTIEARHELIDINLNEYKISQMMSKDHLIDIVDHFQNNEQPA